VVVSRKQEVQREDLGIVGGDIEPRGVERGSMAEETVELGVVR
jgi:hypothetical protein